MADMLANAFDRIAQLERERDEAVQAGARLVLAEATKVAALKTMIEVNFAPRYLAACNYCQGNEKLCERSPDSHCARSMYFRHKNDLQPSKG